MPLPDRAHGRKRLPFVGGDTTHRLRQELEPTSRMPQKRNAKAHTRHTNRVCLHPSRTNCVRVSAESLIGESVASFSRM